ncbi:uncharacterized protein B0H64DRAFT_442862 [Chaetomium fimeti]|uniref:Uncharacterized protein n=1 Tax=Chaetomium fimeti TaxID=1854472 RepID=A0AAE0HH93_9PEZI|nr:hypothetical protein B0H64DRAFT_442862 [Chaetomium fimeti]
MARKRDPVFFSTSPLDDLEQPKIEPMNSTAGEQWEFDGVSEDGTQAFVFGFYRDPNFSFFGAGNLRVYTEFVFANGSRYAIVDYAEESIIESCPHRGTRGTWKADNWSYMFEISADMSQTKLTVDNPEAHITISMVSITPPRYADGSTWPSANTSLLTVPHFYWAEPIPVAEVAVDAVIHGETVSWSGMGGHERLWGAFNWFTCLNSLLVARLRAGPFALSFLEFGSGRQEGLLVPSIILTEDGKHIFGTQRTKRSDTEDYIRVRKLYGGQGITTEALADKVTGLELISTSPRRNEQWEFVITHKSLAFEYNLGSGRGGSAYAGIVVGGLVGRTTFLGPAFSEVMRFPARSMLLSKNFVH